MNQRSKLAAALTVGLVVAVAAAVWLACRLPLDPYGSPELTLPPALVSEAELKGRRALFDSRTTTGWQIEGPWRIENGTLEIGGAEAARATIPGELEEGGRVELDFFQEGAAEATLWVKPTLIAPTPPDSEFLRDIPFDLSLSGLVYRRWHTVRVDAAREGTNAGVGIEIRPWHDGPGRGGGARHSLPARGGCRHKLVFQVAAGSRVLLRNVLASTPAGRK